MKHQMLRAPEGLASLLAEALLLEVTNILFINIDPALYDIVKPKQ